MLSIAILSFLLGYISVCQPLISVFKHKLYKLLIASRFVYLSFYYSKEMSEGPTCVVPQAS